MITLRSRRYLLLLSWIASVCLSFSAPTPSTYNIPHPFFFTENKGQWDSRVLYKCNARNGMTWFLERDGVTLLISQEDRTASPLPDNHRGVWHTPAFSSSSCFDPFDDGLPEMMRKHPPRYPMKSHALKFKFLQSAIDVGGASPAPTLDNSKGVLHTPPLASGNRVVLVNRDPLEKINMGRMQYALTDDPPQSAFAKSVEPQGELSWHNNYFLGNDSTKWAPDCRNYTSVVYRDVWDGIDIEWYESNGKLEFDFVVQPGADPSQIRMSCDGLDCELALSDSRKGALRTPAVSCTPDPSLRGLTSGEDGRKDVAIVSVSGNPVVGAVPPPLGDRDPPVTDEIATSGAERLPRKDQSRFKIAEGRMQYAPTPASRKGALRTPAVNPSVRANRDHHASRDKSVAATKDHARVGAELLLPTSLGELRTALPQVYQISPNGTRSEVDAQFILSGEKNEFGVSLPNGYSPDHILRIDPLVYSTYLGGNSGDVARAITINDQGEISISGETYSTNFPISPGIIDSVRNEYDCFITRLSADGLSLIFSTFLGGSSDESGHDLCRDINDGIIVGGQTWSQNFPTTNGTWLWGNSDGFITRLNSLGNRIISSTVIGGSGNDDAYCIVSDSHGGCYFAGNTNSPDFPTTTGACQRSYGGLYDGYVTHLSDDALDLYGSTFLGGSGIDYAFSMEFDRSRLIVVGNTGSSNYPTTANAFDRTYNGGEYDGYVATLDTSCTQLLYSSFMGGLGYDNISQVIINHHNELLITGSTRSSNFPVTPGAYNTTPSDSQRGFVAKLDSSGSLLRFSTFFGTLNGEAYNRGLSTSPDGLITFVGYTNSIDFPTTTNAFDSTYNGGSYDCYISQLDSSGSHLLYSSLFGGNGVDLGFKIVQTSSGDFLCTGSTNSSNFPMNGVGYDTTYNGGLSYIGDGFVTRFQLDESVVNDPEPQLPHTFSLSQNYPNPFNSSTTLSYSLPSMSQVDLRLYDLTGREIESLVNRKQQAGSYRVIVDGKNLASGTYFVRMQTGDFVKTQKIVLLK